MYYMDHEGQFWDDISGTPLKREEVIAARLGEIKEFHGHEVYEKVPIQ